MTNVPEAPHWPGHRTERRSVASGLIAIGWNPASNSEEGEGFVVREVQGRRGPLIAISLRL